MNRSTLARIALAAWVNVRPDQLPPDKMWIEHPNDQNRQAWDRVVAALFEAFTIGNSEPGDGAERVHAPDASGSPGMNQAKAEGQS